MIRAFSEATTVLDGSIEADIPNNLGDAFAHQFRSQYGNSTDIGSQKNTSSPPLLDSVSQARSDGHTNNSTMPLLRVKTKNPRARFRLQRGCFFSVELTGLEPVTPCLQSRCATNCAIAPGEDSVFVRFVRDGLPQLNVIGEILEDLTNNNADCNCRGDR